MMSRRLVDALLLAGILACLGLNWFLERDTGRPGLEFLPEMVHSPAFKAYTANPFFADGKTLQRPVSGTIARGHEPLHFQATPEDAFRAGLELRNPLAADPPAEGRGGEIYRNFCTPCHGGGGLGDGPVVRRGFPAPASLLADKATALPDGRMFHILTYGQGNMPSYASQISQEERWRVILYVRSLQRSSQGR